MAPRRKPPTTEPRELLEHLRDTLIAAIETARTAPEDKQGQIAPLAKQLRDTLDALARLPQAKESPLDELKKRRAARASGASVPSRAAVPVDSGARGGRAGSKRRTDPGPVASPRPRRRASGDA